MEDVGSGGLPWEAAFARNLRAARERKSWSQTELAKRLTARGVPFWQQQVARIESGERPVRLNEAIMIAQLLETDLEAMTAAPDRETAKRQLVAAQDRVLYIESEMGNWAGVYAAELVKARKALEDAWAAYEAAVESDGEPIDAFLAASATSTRENAERLDRMLSALMGPDE